MKSLTVSLLVALTSAANVPSALAQNALHFTSAGTVAGSSPELRDYDATAGSVPFSLYIPRNPREGDGYGGAEFFGGVFSSANTAADLCQVRDDTGTDGDYLEVSMPAQTPAAESVAALFLWRRDQFNAAWRDVPVTLSTTDGLVVRCRRTGGGVTSSVRFVVQDSSGNFYISSSAGVVPGTLSDIALTSSLTWERYYPYSNAIISGAITPKPTTNPIFAAGVRLEMKVTTQGSSDVVRLYEFGVDADTVSNTDTSSFGLTARAVSENRVNLTWEPCSGANRYVVQRGTSSGSYGAGSPEAARTAFEDYRLSPGTLYFYRVQAYADSALLDTSDEIEVMTDAPEPVASLHDARHPELHFTDEEMSDLTLKMGHMPWSAWYASRRSKADDYIVSDTMGGWIFTVGDVAHTPADLNETDSGDPNYLNFEARGEAAVAMAMVWLLEPYHTSPDASFRAACYDGLVAMLETMPDDPATIYPDYYGSPLRIGYAARNYALAFDIVHNELTPAQRAAIAERLRLHVGLLYDDPKTDSFDDIANKQNNWIQIMGAGLAATGVVLRDHIVSGTNWGETYLDLAFTHLQRAVDPDTTSNPSHPVHPQIRPGGAYIEGEVYSSFTGFWTSEALHALRVVDHSGPELFQSTPYQEWLAYRTRDFTQRGQVTLFGSARETSSDAQRWVNSYLVEAGDAQVQRQLEWLRSVYLKGGTDLNAAFFRYPFAAQYLSEVIEAKSYVDVSGGLAYFRSGSPSATSSDPAGSVVGTFNSRPYPAYIPDYLHPGYATALEHARPDHGSIEVWAHGAYLINQPGYYTGSANTHPAWANTEVEAHNAIEIAGVSPHRWLGAEGFQSWSVDHQLEFAKGLITQPYVAAEDFAPESVETGYPKLLDLGTSLPTPVGGLERTVLFVRPGFFVVYDDVTVDGGAPSTDVDWFIHGAPLQHAATDPGHNLTIAPGSENRLARWANAVPLIDGTNGYEPDTTLAHVEVFQALPRVVGSVFSGVETQTFDEYWTGKTDDQNRFNSDYTAVTRTGASNQLFLNVIYPYSGAPEDGDGMFANVDDQNSVRRGTTIGTASQVAFAQPTNTSIVCRGVTTDALKAFVRKDNDTRLECFFVSEGSELHYGASDDSGFATSGAQMVDLVVDQYDGTNGLRGTVDYVGASSSFDLTIYDPLLPGTTPTITLFDADRNPSSPTTSSHSADIVTFALPAGAAHYDFVVTY